MEKTYIIGRASEPLIKALEFPVIELPTISTDEEIHDFIINRLLEVEFDRLIIPLFQQDGNLGFRIALHIRLTVPLYEKRLIPIMFTSIDRLSKVISVAGVFSNLLSTKACRYEEFEKDVIRTGISLLQPLRTDDYKNFFLDYVVIHPGEKVGRHSLANQWGALSLNRAANTNAALTDPELIKAQKQLYFKFILALSDNYSDIYAKRLKVLGHVYVGKPDQIDALGYNILLIDDEADKGWKNVLSKIFKTNRSDNFRVINEKVKRFEDFSQSSQELIINGAFDLFVVDLRLDGDNEEDTVDPKDFSGTQILKKIKSLNEGNQVIIFTASNKAWNMKALLDQNADGYYIKESPEYNFPIKFSQENYQNFKAEVKKCLELSFLKEIVKKHIDIKQAITANSIGKTSDYLNFYKRSEAALSIVIDLLKKTVKDRKYFNFAYLTYYQILEDFVAQKENFDHVSKFECYVDNGKKQVIRENNGDVVWSLLYSKDRQLDFFVKQSHTYTEPQSVQTLAKISFVLAFQFNKNDADLKNWAQLNHLRNTKAAHGNSGNPIVLTELYMIIELVQLFLSR
jgi:CheY-like chemotaxis protein